MTTYKPTTRCPDCGRSPNIRFSAAEVERAKKERQGARVVSMQCPRCSGRYWIRAREIADATREGGPELPDGFPGRTELMRFGLTSLEMVDACEDLTEIPGIGPKTAEQIQNALVDISVHPGVR